MGSVTVGGAEARGSYVLCEGDGQRSKWISSGAGAWGYEGLTGERGRLRRVAGEAIGPTLIDELSKGVDRESGVQYRSASF